MSARPVLGDWEIPHIHAIYSTEKRTFSEFQVPGRSGSLLQDMNTEPLKLAITGSLYGEECRDEFFQQVREKFLSGEPLTFTADILTATELQYVVIESLKFHASGNAPDETDFLIVLRESPPPPPPPDPLGGLDSDLLDQAAGFVDSVTGALDALDALGDIPDINDPTPPLRNTLSGVSDAVGGLGDIASSIADLFGGNDS